MPHRSLLHTRRRIRSTSDLSIASLFTLTQIARYGLIEWRPRTATSAPFGILNDPKQTSLNPRTLSLLVRAGMIDTVDGSLVLTPTGERTVADNLDLYPHAAPDERAS